MIGYWHLVDQIMFIESILKTIPKEWIFVDSKGQTSSQFYLFPINKINDTVFFSITPINFIKWYFKTSNGLIIWRTCQSIV